MSWWCYNTEMFSMLLAPCEGNPPVTGFLHYWPFVWRIHQWLVDSPFRGSAKRILMLSLMLTRTSCWKKCRKQSRHWWFETPWAHFTLLQCSDKVIVRSGALCPVSSKWSLTKVPCPSKEKWDNVKHIIIIKIYMWLDVSTAASQGKAIKPLCSKNCRSVYIVGSLKEFDILVWHWVELKGLINK